jgi:1,5-anhydro-D-fructose reductase (1,5-anhydro-D-mannitol-forming)
LACVPNPPLRVAVLGFWHVHAGDYAKRAQQHPHTELVAVWDDDAARGQAGAADFGVEFTDDLDALLARDDIDAVTITTESIGHRDLLVKVANAGKHIFTEKVLAVTVAEAEEIIAAADRNGVKLIVSLPRLYHGYTLAITEILASGKLGQLTQARVRLSHDGATRGWLPERFFERATTGGGALIDLGCHPVYLTQLFLGSTPDTVSATYRSVTHRAVEDHAVVTVGYPDQSIAVIEAGFVSDNPFTIEINGTEGRVHYTQAGNALTVSGPGFGGGEPQSLSVPDHGQDAFGQWVDHIRADTRADDNLARAVELTRLIVAANRSAAEQTTITYPSA